MRTRTSIGLSLVARYESALLDWIRQPDDAALGRIGGADVLWLRAVGERAHQAFRADVLRALLGAEERDHLPVPRPRRRAAVRDQPVCVLAVGVDHPEIALVHVDEALSVGRPVRRVTVDADRVGAVALRVDQEELPLLGLFRPVLDVCDPVPRRAHATSDTFRVAVSCSASDTVTEVTQMSYFPSSCGECRNASCSPSGARLGPESNPGGTGAFTGAKPSGPETRIDLPSSVSQASFSPFRETLRSSKMLCRHNVFLSLPSKNMCCTPQPSRTAIRPGYLGMNGPSPRVNA